MVGAGGRGVFAAAILSTSVAIAHADDGFLHRLTADVNQRLDALLAARVPKLVPPVPIAVKWQPKKLHSFDLGSPLVALAAADLDGDGKAEVYAVTSREVIALGLGDQRRWKELGRVAFGGEPTVVAPRDIVGSAIVDGRVVVASVSTWPRGLRVTWRSKALVGDPGDPGFELCAGEHVELAPGRNYFGDAANAWYGTRCRNDLVDPTGHPLHVRAQLAVGGKLAVAVDNCPSAASCTHAADFTYTRVGVAFDLADLDRDGNPEVIFASSGAPGDPDDLRVVTLGEDEKKTKLRKSFAAEGVAGIAVADIDGDGAPEVVAAVRLVGSTRVDLWRMN